MIDVGAGATDKSVSTKHIHKRMNLPRRFILTFQLAASSHAHQGEFLQERVELITRRHGDLVVYLSNGDAERVSRFCEWRWFEKAYRDP
jgi:hypothetical protein